MPGGGFTTGVLFGPASGAGLTMVGSIWDGGLITGSCSFCLASCLAGGISGGFC